MKQIKSKERVSAFGEVYTNTREVSSMLDLVKDEASSITSTFLEPACGNGNFLAEILNRKLKTVNALYFEDMSDYITHMIQAIASIYGVDIQNDNVLESRNRLVKICSENFENMFGQPISDGALKAINCVLRRNILCGNTLTCLAHNGKPLVFSEWILNDQGMFERTDYPLIDIISNCANNKKKSKTYDWRKVA